MYYILFPPYALRPTLSRLCAFFLLVFSLQPVFSQTPDSICSVIRVSHAYAAPGDTVALDVRATIPTGLISLQFKLKWDNTSLLFDHADINGTALAGLSVSDIYSGNSGEVRISWYDLSGLGITFGDDALLFRLYVRVKPDAAPFTAVRFDPAPIGFVYEAYSDIDFKLPYNLSAGGVTTETDSLTYPWVSSICSYRASCEGAPPSGGINLQLEGGAPPYSYDWSGPNNFSSYNEDISGVKAGKYYVTVTDVNGLSVEATTEVLEGLSTLEISDVQTQEDPCNRSQGYISIAVNGGQPPYSYLWSPGIHPDTSAIQELGPGNYEVSVQDATGCIIKESFSLAFTQPLNISTTTIAPVCGPGATAGKIVLSPFGGTPPYTYSWNDPAASGNTYENCPAGLYVVTVGDNNGCTFVRNVVLNHQSTNQWLISQQNLCTPGESTGKVVLTASSNNLIQWPVSVQWSTGATHTAQSGNGMSGADTLSGLADGFYNATLIDALGCTHTVLNLESNCGFLNTFDDQNCFNLRIESAPANPGDFLCIPVAAETFTGIRRMKIRLYWNPEVLEFKGLTSQDLSVNDIQLLQNADNVDIDWFSSLPIGQGLTLVNGSYLYNVCFKVKDNAPAGLTQVRFDKPTVALSNFINLKNGRQIGVMGFDGQITVGNAPFNVISLSGCTNLPLCDEDGLATLDLQVSNGTPPYSAMWSNNLDQPQSGGIDDIRFLKAGFYRVTITDQAGKIGTMGFLYQNPYGPFNCIWPGDADNNNSVNHFDVLYLGLGYDSDGQERPDVSTEWAGNSATPWALSTPFRQVNYSNMDCNGDGLVNDDDLAAVSINWNQVIRPGLDDPMAKPFIPPAFNIDSFSLHIGTDTLEDAPFSLPVNVGAIDDTAHAVLGLAFSIVYDTERIDPGSVDFIASNSWLGNPANNLFVFKKSSIPGRLDVVLSRKSGNSTATGWGAIGQFSGQLLDLPGGPLPDLLETELRIENWLGLSANERALPIDGQATSVFIRVDSVSSVSDAGSLPFGLRCYPNPARSSATVAVNGAVINGLEICAVSGTMQRRIHGFEQPVAQLDLAGLTPGFYWLKVLTDRGTAWLKLSVL